MTSKTQLSFVLDRDGDLSLQEQLAGELRQRILDGRISPGESLPSSREIARDLRLSRNTVIAACDRLLGEGYLEARTRSGLFVSHQLARTARNENRSNATGPERISRAARLPDRLSEPVPFRPCRPDARLFPLAKWNRHRSRALRKFGTSLFHYQRSCTLGLPSLREALADYLTESRGVRCEASQVAITSGSQQALFLLSQLLVQPGDQVLLEDPGYRGARHAFAHARARIRTLAVDENGAVPPKGPVRARVIYTTPSRQFPTGACLPVARRMALLDAASRSGAWMIEDDYDSEFRYARPPLPSLHSLDTTGHVIYLGSMSKVLWSSLRIGYVVLPPELVEDFGRLKMLVDEHGPLLEQATLSNFIASGDFYTHLRRCRKIYARRLEAFLESANRNRLPLDFPFTDGGMNQTGFLRDAEIDSAQCSRALADSGWDVPATAEFSHGRTRPGLVFGFTAFDETTIATGMARVARDLDRYLASRRSSA